MWIYSERRRHVCASGLCKIQKGAFPVQSSFLTNFQVPVAGSNTGLLNLWRGGVGSFSRSVDE